jgi:hypothetical protein
MFSNLRLPGRAQETKPPRLSKQELDEMHAKLQSTSGTEAVKGIIQAQKPPSKCDYDLCSPKSYGWTNCPLGPLGHDELHLHKNMEKNRYGHAVYAPPRLLGNRDESIHLVRGMVQYMDRQRDHLNNDQMAAQISLKQWITELSVLDLPQVGNGDELISMDEMRRELEWINVLFFGGDMPDLTFRWLSDSEDAKVLKSQGYHPREAYSIHGHEYCDEQGHIYVNLISDCIAGDFGSYRKLSILSVLVREALHAFLNRYSCNDYIAKHSRRMSMPSRVTAGRGSSLRYNLKNPLRR